MKSFTFRQMLGRNPVYPVEHAVKGMLPKNRLGRKLFHNMKVYAGSKHPHAAQKPEQLDI
jgi:large subunit ribosomal protein L13